MAADTWQRSSPKGDKVGMLEGIKTALTATSGGWFRGRDAGRRASRSSMCRAPNGNGHRNRVGVGDDQRAPRHQGLPVWKRQHAFGAVAPSKRPAASGRFGLSATTASRPRGRQSRKVRSATIEQHADRLAVFEIEYALQLLRANRRSRTSKRRWSWSTAESLK